MRKSIYNAKKRKYTAMSAVITALFIAVVLVLNIAFYALANHFVWYADMTKGQVYTLSDATKDLLSDVDDEVNIYFTVEPDKISETSPYLYYVYQTALQMEAQYDNIHVKCVDIVKNPAFFKTYYTTAAQDIYTTSVIVESNNDFRLFRIDAFFITDEDDTSKIWAYQGEMKIVSAVLSMTSTDMPTVCFTTAHGEMVGDDSAALVQLFSDAGYNVVNVDLSKEDFPDNTRIVIINNPVYDFSGISTDADTDSTDNEIDKLDAFLDSYGCLMVFSSPSYAGNLTNLSEFLAEWGIAFTPDTFIRDKDNSVSVDGRSLVAKYEEDTLGASLYTDISGLDTMPKTILKNAMPLQILFDNNDALDGAKDVSAVLSSYDTSVAASDGKDVGTGSYPLMVVSRETRIVDNEYYYSYVLACGSSDYTAAEYLQSNTYANSDILYNAMKITGRDRIVADIKYKELDDTTLDITTAQANRWTAVLTFVFPVVLGIAGVCVWVRRKNS